MKNVHKLNKLFPSVKGKENNMKTYTVQYQMTDIKTDNTDTDFDTFEASSDKQAIAIAVKKYNGITMTNTGPEDRFLETIWSGDITWVLTNEDDYLENWL